MAVNDNSYSCRLEEEEGSGADGEERQENYCKYLIIGGGISGLSAANELVKQGVRSLKLLEARNRLGGRIITVHIGGTKTELGANWIHGVLGNPLYELAASNGLVELTPEPPKAHNVAATTEDGRRLPFSILQETYEAYFWFFKRCEEYFLCKYRPPEGVSSVGDHIELEISIYLQKFPQQQRHLRRLVFDYLLQRECCITGCNNMKEVDLISIGSYTELPGGNITIPHGYSSLLSPIIKPIPPSCILKAHPVKHIHWNYRSEMEALEDSDGNSSDCSVKTVRSAHKSTSEPPVSPPTTNNATAESSMQSSVCPSPSNKSGIPNVKVECENGKVFYSDHVICTIPLGVLRHPSSETLFQPPLPQEKKSSFKKMAFGVVNKIYLEFERPFLSPDISEIIILWNRVLNPENVPMKDRWFRKIYSFCKTSETLLVCWISGEEAVYMESLSITQIAETCTSILRKFLADPYVPNPKSCVFTAWNSQPYSRGSYSAIGVGGTQKDIEKLAESLYQKHNHKKVPVVGFAGEHCHPSFYSTGHGAYLSGRSVAQSLIKSSRNTDEEVYNLAAASVADLSTWLEEVSLGEKCLDDFKTRPKRDSGKFVTPR
eukprot:TRINITY_DN6071_c0_g1_i1.p1 TRINITY_DN6071_c0_g1~~TRINITY_DN6071_c0_g1_i1.p1  ORF type:complete len:603 (-),score=162.69 TRINITY_DN6071_c0_g1_i1:421-2229(-)